MTTTTLTQLIIYPIDGVAGVSIRETEVSVAGLRHDREFILIDHEGQLVSPNRAPNMRQMKIEFDDKFMAISYPDHSTQLIRHTPRAQGLRIPVDISGKRGYGVDRGPDVAIWFSDCLGLSCSLVQCDFEIIKQRSIGADEFSAILVPELDNSEDTTPAPMSQFKPNLIVGGCATPFAVNSWNFVTINETRFVTVHDQFPRPLQAGKKLKVSCAGTIRVGNMVHAS